MKKRLTILLLTLIFALFATQAGADLTRQDQTIYGKKTFAHDTLFKKNLTLEGALLGVNQYSTVYWVDSATGNDGGGFGSTYLKPFATVDYAINQCTADKGDIIYVMPSHAETVSAANGFDADVAGVQIIGLGNGSDMPTFNFSATASTVAIGAANVVLEGLRFSAGISDIVIGLAIEAGGDNATVRGCEWTFTSGATTFEFLDAIDLATGVDDLKVIGNIYSGATASATNHFIESGNGICARAQIIGNVIRGLFAVSAIWSNDAHTDWLIKDNIIENKTSGQHCIEFTAAATGQIIGNVLAGAIPGTILDPGSMLAYRNEIIETDITDSNDMGMMVDKWSSAVTSHELGGAAAVSGVSLFTVTGTVEVKVFGSVTETVTSHADTISIGTNDSPVLLIAATAGNAPMTAGDTWTSATIAKSAASPSSFIIDDETIIARQSGVNLTGGTVMIRVYWRPLSAGATLVSN